MEGLLVPGLKVCFEKVQQGCSIGSDQDDWCSSETVTSIEIDHRPVCQIRILPGENGSKVAEVVFEDEDTPVIRTDRRCAIKVAKMPPCGAEVSLSQE